MARTPRPHNGNGTPTDAPRVSPAARRQRGLGDLAALVRAAETSAERGPNSTVGAEERIQRHRRMVATLCRLLGGQLETPPQASGSNGRGAAAGADHKENSAGQADPLPPRLRQTLDALLAGDGEKQIAHKLGISQHTVHVYVKGLYRRFGVCSRGELLARFVERPRAASRAGSGG